MNWVFIVSDTLRWDYLGCYGNDWIKTPNLDRLARQSAVFTNAYAESLPTLPARRSMQTGRVCTPARYVQQHTDSVANYGWHPLFDQDVTAAEWLTEQGYYPGFVTDVYHMLKPGKNFHRGFYYWQWVRGQEGDMYGIRDKRRVVDLLRQTTADADAMPDEHWVIQHLVCRKHWRTDADTSVAQVMRGAASFIESYTPDKPFYLWVDCFDPHEPWDPPAEFAREYYADYEGLYGVCPPGLIGGLDEHVYECVKAAYAGEVTLVDKWVGYLLDALDAKGVMDDTLIVFTSDHGTMMGEQGELHKGESRLRHQCTRVPLLIRHPRGELAGQEIDAFVQHHDILPTALGIMGLDAPERVTGRDAWPIAMGERRDEVESVFIGWSRYCSVRTRDYDLILPLWEDNIDGPGVRELYDLRNDPDELVNVINDHPTVARELAELAQEYIRAQAPLTKGSIQEPDAKTMRDAAITFDALPEVR